MKKHTLILHLIILFALVTPDLFAQAANPELIKDRAEAQTFYRNFQTMYQTVAFDEKGGSISLESLQALVAQMEANHSSKVEYYFGRTTADKYGHNFIMFFNVGYTVSQLNGLSKIRSIEWCPPNCDTTDDAYVK